MRTVFAGLPFYDSVDKIDKRRINSRVPFHSPRHQLPPFLINAQTDTPGAVTKVELQGCSESFGSTNLISAWSTLSYETFTTVGPIITRAINDAGGGSGVAYTGVIAVNKGDIVQVTVNLTLNSGQLPFIYLFDPTVPLGTYGECSDVVTLAAGVNVIELSPTIQSNNIKLAIYNAAAASDWSTSVFSVVSVIGRKNITSWFVAVPALFTTTANDYFQYKGVVLKQALPTGQYIVKITTANGFTYYSENIVISDIYPNLITGWVNGNYETLTSSGTTITSAIETGVAGTCLAAITSVKKGVKKGNVFVCRFNLTLNSGQLPSVYLVQTGGVIISNTVVCVNGVNTVTLTCTADSSSVTLRFFNTAASNFSTSEVFVLRSFSSRFIKLDFYNSKDLGDILYQDSWKQTLWLETRLNYPSSETVEIGEEKDGIFLPEKIVTKYIYRISTYISRAMHAVLCRLPQHSSITITDEVGNTYTPAVGNLQITSMEWSHFETGHIVISFNDGDNSAFEWTYDMANLT